MSIYVIAGIILFGFLLVLAAWGDQREKKRREEELRAARAVHEEAKAASAIVRDRQDELVALAPGVRIEFGGCTYTVISFIIFAEPIWQMPQYRFMLSDGSNTKRWLDLQTRWYGHYGVWMVTEKEYAGSIPDMEDPAEVEFEGRSFRAGLRGSTYYYATASDVYADPAGIKHFFRYLPEDSRDERGYHKPYSDSLHFERIGDGDWTVSLAKEVRATDVTVQVA